MESTQYLLAGLYPASLRRAGLDLTIHVRPWRRNSSTTLPQPVLACKPSTLPSMFNSKSPHDHSCRPLNARTLSTSTPTPSSSPRARRRQNGSRPALPITTSSTPMRASWAMARAPYLGSREAVTDMGRVLAGVWYGVSPRTTHSVVACSYHFPGRIVPKGVLWLSRIHPPLHGPSCERHNEPHRGRCWTDACRSRG
ncbi:hypothetical protein M427DRAFT_467542 [Gonapodya prolifera JEL478]|uniref:Uncharacterized protein n=1 Tax=Gonapodya prolifera (strain JEL478) TaxID=1344416 RepID=A0A139A1L4_GONPJ|nr:hypothetical protein M427DRAFT_467542 [Gonapodya prolifera JEL478]|eukprot:KXS10624.1 hypothetical protein M427DRAFT_467542 [Gonapodya prolifera JEL478]